MLTRITANAAIPSVPYDQEALDGLRRKLEFRAWRRGTSEADLLIGTFADQCLAWFDAEELRQFERLLEEDDPVIDDWITGRQLVPREHDNSVMALLRRFCLGALDRPAPVTADERRLRTHSGDRLRQQRSRIAPWN